MAKAAAEKPSAPSTGGATATISATPTTEEKAENGATATSATATQPAASAATVSAATTTGVISAATASSTAGSNATTATATSVAPAAATPATPAAAAVATLATPAAASSTGNATATSTSASSRPSGGLPLGRPGKPMIAAAVAGGLILIGASFLVPGLPWSDDETAPPSAQGPSGSRMGPDGSGPGLVPGRQNAPNEGISKTGTGGTEPGEATVERGSDNVTETGSGSADKGTGTGTQTVPEDKNGVPAPGVSKQPSAPADRPPADQPAADQPVATRPATTQPAAAKNQQTARATYTHLIGPGCNTSGFATSEQYRDSNKGWRGSRNSTTAYGCSGFYYSVPLSGSTSKSNGVYAQWKFTTGSVTKGSCKVSVYIPNVKDISYVGGNPAHYTVHRYFDAKPSTRIGSFEINQPAHLGQWVSAGTFPASTGKISVVLDNRGKTSGNRHAAAAPLRVNCTAA